MLPAIEAPAQQRAAIVDGASRRAQIHALAVRLGGEQEQRIPRRLVRHHPMPVLFDLVAVFRMKKEPLIASTALGAAVTGHVGLSV